jgi:putative hemolysin
MLVLVVLVVVFLFLSGLAAAVDAAVLSVSRPEVEVLVEQRRWGARRLRSVKRQLTQSVVVIVIVTNTINVLGPILVSREAQSLYGVEGLAAITVVLALGTMVFSEIIPKSLGAHYAPRVARLAAPGIRWLRILLYPLVITLAALSRLFTRGTRQIGTEEQIRSLVRIGDSAGLIESDEGQLIHRVFIMNDKTAGEIMTPLEHVKGIDASYSISQAASEIARSEYSRYPIFEGSTDKVGGMAMSRDVLKAMASGREDAGVMSISRPALIVEASCTCDDLLLRFRDEHAHLAIVQDTGRTVGVCSLEDVIEELVGEIEDEKDVVVTRKPNHSRDR